MPARNQSKAKYTSYGIVVFQRNKVVFVALSFSHALPQEPKIHVEAQLYELSLLKQTSVRQPYFKGRVFLAK
jgi:hypothetical protein